MQSSASGVAQIVSREPVLEWLSLADAFEEGEPNLFSVLRWDYRLVDTLYGRRDDLNKILAWAENGSKTTSARLITGEGGAGKTRLAATAAQRLREKGWTAGFLPKGDALIDLNAGAKGLFLILDYPEEQPERTAALLQELAERKTAPYPFRVLLLSRRSFAEWERETTLLDGRFGRQEIAAAEPLNLDDATLLVEVAARNIAKQMGRALPDLKEASRWLQASPIHRLPLYATAAAIHAVLYPTEAFGLAKGELLQKLALRELRRVRKISEVIGFGPEGLERLLALGVAADGLSESAVIELAKAGVCESSKPDIVAVLSRSPWWKKGRLIPLEPDVIAAVFLDLALFDERFPKGREALSEWLFIALQENAATLGNRLGRVFYDLDAAGRKDGGLHPLDARLEQMLITSPQRALSFANVAGMEVHIWSANFAAHVALLLSEILDSKEDKAGFLNNAASYLSALGRREEALAAAQEAADLYRELARARPDAFLPDLAMSLINLGCMLSELGRREKALTAVQEAADLYRELARARHDAFQPGLAMSLNNLGNSLSEVGRREKALAAVREAADLYRELARARPDAFRPGLAMSLNNLGITLSEIGRREEALTAAQEAADLYRELARARPDAFRPGLAISLNNLGNILSEVSRREEALAAAQEAANLYRELARARPDAFQPDWAMSLNNLGIRLSELGRREAALAAVREAADLYRELALARPDAFRPDLASSLNNLGIRLSEVGRREEALTAVQEAADLYRELARALPDAFRPDLALSLNSLGNRLSEVGRREEALTAAQEAADLYRELARARPDAFQPDLAMSLNNLGNSLSEVGRREKALAAVREAADLYRELARARPDAFRPDLAGSLNNLGNTLSEVGRREEALAVYAEREALIEP